MQAQEWAAVVSAGAAVIQAIAAGLAIWYSGKLARDGAKREKAAEIAATRRIKEANLAAEERRRLDDEASERRRVKEVLDRENSPINFLLDLGQAAHEEMSRELQRLERLQPGEAANIEVGPARIAIGNHPAGLLERAVDARDVAAMQAVISILAPPSFYPIADAASLAGAMRARLGEVEKKMTALRDRLRPLPNSAVPAVAEDR